MGAPDLEAPVIKYVQEFLKSDATARKKYEQIVAKLTRDQKTLGPIQPRMISERLVYGHAMKDKWDPALRKKYPDDKLFPYQLERTYILTQEVRNSAKVALPERLVSEVRISAVVVRRDHKDRSENVSVVSQKKLVSFSLVEKPDPPLEFTILENWGYAEEAEPGVLVLKDVVSYEKKFQELTANSTPPKPEKVDFRTDRVCLLSSGAASPPPDIPSRSVSVTGDAKEGGRYRENCNPTARVRGRNHQPSNRPCCAEERKSTKSSSPGDRILGTDFSSSKTKGLEILVK